MTLMDLHIQQIIAGNKIQNAVTSEEVTVTQEVTNKLNRLSQRNADAHRIVVLSKK